MTDSLIGLLEPISDQEWHGKWRIKKALDILRSQQSEISVVDYKLALRDDFIVSKGLWHEFVDSLSADGIMRQPEPVSGSGLLEKCAKAIQERYWKGDIAITILDASAVCIEFAKVVLDTAGVKYAD